MDTRERILTTASEMMRDGSERLSVRAIAARAGVGASTLRHYFPTQRALVDAVLTRVITDSMPDDRIRDTSLPARERLRDSVWGLIELDGVDSRTQWQSLYAAFLAPEATDAARAVYHVLVERTQQQVEGWLALLEAEGALPPGDNPQRAHLLLAVIDGLSLERALSGTESRLAREAATLTLAVDAVFGGPASS